MMSPTGAEPTRGARHNPTAATRIPGESLTHPGRTPVTVQIRDRDRSPTTSQLQSPSHLFTPLWIQYAVRYGAPWPG